MSDKLTAADVKRLASGADTIKSLDQTIEWIGRDIDKDAKEWGDKARDIFGRNRLGQFTNEDLGQIVAIGIINALLHDRLRAAANVSDLLAVDDPPCPAQTLDFLNKD